MESHRTGKPHLTEWVLAVVAVPVLYVLTLPWVAFLAHRASPKSPPAWFLAYAVPWALLQETPLRKPLEEYGQLVKKVMAP